MEEFVNDLVVHEMAYPNPTSKCACAPLLVPGPGARFHFTMQLRTVNIFTVRHQFSILNLEHKLSSVKDAIFFAKFDVSHGFWQLLLSLLSQECQYLFKPDCIFTPTWVIHGTTNAMSSLQLYLTSIISGDLSANILVWPDNLLLHASTMEILLESI